MKKFCLLLCVAMMLALVSCGTSNEKRNEDDLDSSQIESTLDEPSQAQSSQEEPSESEFESESEDYQQQCTEALRKVKVNVLSTAVVDYKDAYINGYGAYSEDYEKATVITIGINFPEGVYRKYWDDMTIKGETATAADGSPVPQSYSSAGWVSDDDTYAVIICRLAGEVDASKVVVEIQGEDDVVIDTAFENNGESAGFSEAINHFPEDDTQYGVGNRIVKLHGRHYFIIRRYLSSTGSHSSDEGRYATRTMSFIMLPLEGGLKQTLTKDDFDIIFDKELVADITGVKATVWVNTNGKVDGSVFRDQTTIELEVWSKYNDDADSNQETYDNIDKMFSAIHLECDDGDGNTVTLLFVD